MKILIGCNGDILDENENLVTDVKDQPDGDSYAHHSIKSRSTEAQNTCTQDG